jgi:hypothetical protein
MRCVRGISIPAFGGSHAVSLLAGGKSTMPTLKLSSSLMAALLQSPHTVWTGLAQFIPLIVIAAVIYFVWKMRSRNLGLRLSANDSEFVTDPSLSSRISALMKRYRDAYIVARVTNGFGGMIKTTGIVIVVLLVLIGFMIISSMRGPMDTASIIEVVAVVFGIIIGIITGAWFYIIGVLVSAQGQILKASLDSAVNSSPFLTNEHKAKIMSLPEA